MDHLTRLAQIEFRVVQTLGAIVKKPTPVNDGLAIPAVRSIPIGTGRRLEATVLFLDICGFSERPLETLDEQALVLRMMTLLFSEFIRIIEDFDGVVEKNTGDGLMAYFTRQAGQEQHHASRAVEAALYMFYAAEKFINPIFHLAQVKPFNFRVAINTGSITVADVGVRGGYRGIVAIGTTANVACKMLNVAGAGELLLGAHTFDALREDWKQYAAAHSFSEKFSYRSTNQPYMYYRYGGRFI